MANKCIYCNKEIPVNSELSVCDPCGVKVWGPKMLQAIRSGMKASKERGDLEQGNVY